MGESSIHEMSGLDAVFLYAETNTAHMHVIGTILLEPSDQPFELESLTTLIESRLHEVPAFRQRLEHVPFRLGHPVWVDDPHFRLASHLHRIGLPEPGSLHELADFVGHIASIPLDRQRPLWDVWVVEGLQDGGVALVCKFHHAAIDGVSGADLMQHLFDTTPDWRDEDRPRPPQPAPPPSELGLLTKAVTAIAREPFDLLRTAARTFRSLAAMAATYLDPRSEVRDPAIPLFSPKTLLNRAISSDRCVALGSVALADLKAVKNALGLTVNDVVLAACSLALREYLREHDDLPDAPLVAAVPVSLHDDGDGDATNAVTAMFVRLPVHLEDPHEQLDFVRAEAAEAKALHRSSSSSLLAEWAQYASPTWFAALVNLYSRFDLADSHAPLYNVVISNVRGPSFPLYCVGHRVSRCHPLGPIFEGAAVNMTVMSYLDTVQIGVLACPDSTPDVWSIATGFEQAVRTLVDAVVPKPRRRPAATTRRRSDSRRRKRAHK